MEFPAESTLETPNPDNGLKTARIVFVVNKPNSGLSTMRFRCKRTIQQQQEDPLGSSNQSVPENENNKILPRKTYSKAAKIWKGATDSPTPPCILCKTAASVWSMNVTERMKDVELLKFLCQLLGIDFDQDFQPSLVNFPVCAVCWKSYNNVYARYIGGISDDPDTARVSLINIQESIRYIQQRRFPNMDVDPVKLSLKDLPKTWFKEAAATSHIGEGFIRFDYSKTSPSTLEIQQVPQTKPNDASKNENVPGSTLLPNIVRRTTNNSAITISIKPKTTCLPTTPEAVDVDPLDFDGDPLGLDVDPLGFDTNESAPMDMTLRRFELDHTYCLTKSVVCEFCHTDLKDEEQLFSHFVSDHGDQPKSFVCLRCGRNFVSIILLKKHTALHNMEESQPITCEICEDRFNSDLPYHRHLDQHTVNRKNFSSIGRRRRSAACLYCKKEFSTFTLLREHELKTHKLELKFVCPEVKCKEPFSHLYLLNAHKVCHRSELSHLTNNEEKEGLFPCLICKLKLETAKALKYHHLAHLAFSERNSKLRNNTLIREMSLYCKKCGQAFIKQEELSLHEKSFVHVSNCELCPEFYFPSPSDLSNHVIEKHEWTSTEKLNECRKPNCKASFATGFMYNRHLRFHHLVKCPLCELGIIATSSKKLAQKSKIRKHMMIHHPKASKEEWRCSICLLNCNNPLTFTVHIQRQHPELLTFLCAICDKAFGSQEHLDSHSQTHMVDNEVNPEQQIFDCHCATSFISSEKFIEHLTNIHTGEDLFSCDICSDGTLSPALFRNKENYQAHMDKEHSSPIRSAKSLSLWSGLDFDALIEQYLESATSFYASRISGETLTTLVPALSNMDSENPIMNNNNPINSEKCLKLDAPEKNGVKCKVCGKILKNSLSLNRHEQTHPEIFIYKCSEPDCENSKFVSEVHLLTHAQIHRNEDPPTPLVCFCCSRFPPFDSKEELLKHLQTHTRIKTYKCNNCPCTFTTSGNLTRHQQSVHSTNFETFDCPDCPRKCPTPGALYAHRRDNHSPVVQCDQCGESVDKYKLKMHLFKKHKIGTGILTRNRKFNPRRTPVTRKCYFCSKEFSGNQNLRDHISIHTREKSNSCPYCQKKFSLKENLSYHVKSSHSEVDDADNTVVSEDKSSKLKTSKRIRRRNSRKFECKICNRKFSRLFCLNNHMNIHNGIEPYKCSVCDRGFPSHISLAGHLLSHRSLDPKEINRNEATKAFSKTWKPFKCKYCDKLFTVKTQYKYHLNKHSGKNPYKCHICGVRFPHAGWFLGHKKTHVMWGDYVKRPDNMRGALPESDEEEEEQQQPSVTDIDVVDKNLGQSGQTEPESLLPVPENNVLFQQEQAENPYFPTFTFQQALL